MIGRSIALDDEMHRCAARARKSASQHAYAARRAQPRDDGGAKCAHHARVALGYALGKELDDLQHFYLPLLGLRRKHRFGSGRFAAATAAVANSLLSRFRAPRALIPRESMVHSRVSDGLLRQNPYFRSRPRSGRLALARRFLPSGR